VSTQEFDARRTGPRYLTLGAALRRTVGARRGGRRRSVAQRDGRRRSIAASGESPEDGFFVGNGCGGEDGGLQPAWRRQTCLQHRLESCHTRALSPRQIHLSREPDEKRAISETGDERAREDQDLV
jgi:hypothetical protein